MRFTSSFLWRDRPLLRKDSQTSSLTSLIGKANSGDIQVCSWPRKTILRLIREIWVLFRMPKTSVMIRPHLQNHHARNSRRKPPCLHSKVRKSAVGGNKNRSTRKAAALSSMLGMRARISRRGRRRWTSTSKISRINLWRLVRRIIGSCPRLTRHASTYSKQHRPYHHMENTSMSTLARWGTI